MIEHSGWGESICDPGICWWR